MNFFEKSTKLHSSEIKQEVAQNLLLCWRHHWCQFCDVITVLFFVRFVTSLWNNNNNYNHSTTAIDAFSTTIIKSKKCCCLQFLKVYLDQFDNTGSAGLIPRLTTSLYKVFIFIFLWNDIFNINLTRSGYNCALLSQNV